MSDSTKIIKRYYHSIKSINTSSIIQQIDYLSLIVKDLLNADFVGVLTRQYNDGELIPISFQGSAENMEIDFRSFEESWCKPQINKHTLEKRIICKENAGNLSENPDSFAKHHHFNYVGCLPSFERDRIHLLITVYWHEKPDIPFDVLERIVQTIYNLLDSFRNSMNDNRFINDYTLRLSDLIALFETPIEDYNFDSMLKLLLVKIQKIIPGTFMHFASSGNSNEFTLQQSKSQQPPQSSFTDLFGRELAELSIELKQVSNLNGIWIDYSDQFQSHFSTVLTSPLYVSNAKKHFIVIVSKNRNSISQNDRQLLSVFSLFAGILLKVVEIYRQEKKVNKLLKKSSSQMADVETLAALTDMTSGVAHDFNNMIGGIIGRVQLLKLKVKDAETLEKLDKIEQLAANGADTVKRIQEFTSGARYKDLHKLEIVDICKEYFTNKSWKWVKLASEKEVNVVFKNEVRMATIEGSDGDLMIALDKILLNAVEYSERGSTVSCTLKKSNSFVEILIHNYGVPISESDQKKIFYPFFTTKHEYGAGMGLAIVHGIVIRHGGKISVHSTQKDGTTFQLLIPISDTVSEDSEITKKTKKRDNIRILVVDDDEQIREVLTDLLTIDGYEVTTCEDGKSALKEFEVNDFEMMITDLGMPGMSGLELSGIVHEQKPALPIAMITGWGTQLNKDEVALKGVRAVVPKPFHLKEIKALISELVEYV